MKIGIIGGGNMGEAFVSGLCLNKGVNPKDIIVYDTHPEKREYFANTYQVQTAESEVDVAYFANIIVLSVKPYHYADVLQKISSRLMPEKIVISITPGYRFSSLEACVNSGFSNFVVAMSNTAAKIGKASTAACFPESMSDTDKNEVKKFFESFGSFFEIKESQMPAITSLIGSSPAIVYMLLEGLLQGAIRDGIPQGQARELAADIVLSSAAMLKESNDHPAKLRDNICSPNGSTIEGVNFLEKEGFTGEVMEAMHRITKRSLEMME